MPFTNPPRSDDLVCPPKRRRGRALVALGGAAALVLTGVLASPAQAAHPEVSLPGSNFEIDANANLKVDDVGQMPASIDWLSVADVPKQDTPSGSGDDSYKGGQKEDTENPKLEAGSIPPNKSDLKTFSTYLETAGNQKFLHMFWHRVQDPSGTTNMDFEFNQLSTLSDNGVTPDRAAGDLLIQYDLANGGTNPKLFLSTWITSAAAGVCESGNTYPCWEKKEDLSAQGLATGSINTTAIPASESGGAPPGGLGDVSPRTFGEATVNFTSFFDPAKCVSFGSVHLKSRSSDSFDSALKDFIAPASTNIDNCASVIIRKQTDPEENPNATTFGYTKSFTTDPASANTFTLQDDGVYQKDNVVLGTGLTVVEDVIPQGWDFVNVNCSASKNVTPSINGATVTFALDDPGDVLDCTYNNRARGTIIVEKITDDGAGAFSFSSNTLSPSPFVLTTSAAGAGGKDARTFSDLSPGTYDVAETVPASWNLVSSTCSDGSSPASIGLSGGETVTCTFHDAREVGAIKIVKDRKFAGLGGGDHPHPGVTFTITGGELPAAGVTAVTDANGVACVSGLVVSALVGAYSVLESVPAGYVAKSTNPQSATVVESTCASNPVTKQFHNMPLTDITVSVNSQTEENGKGGTASTIDCDSADDPPFDKSTDANGDGSFTMPNLEPGVYVCTVIVDP